MDVLTQSSVVKHNPSYFTLLRLAHRRGMQSFDLGIQRNNEQLTVHFASELFLQTKSDIVLLFLNTAPFLQTSKVHICIVMFPVEALTLLSRVQGNTRLVINTKCVFHE